METAHSAMRPSCGAPVRRKGGPHAVLAPDEAAEGVGPDASSAVSRETAPHAARTDEPRAGRPVPMTTSELEAHLVRTLTTRTHGQVQALTVQIRGGQTVLSGFAESYYAIQLMLAGLRETVDALGLDRPGRVDLNIEVMPRLPARR